MSPQVCIPCLWHVNHEPQRSKVGKLAGVLPERKRKDKEMESNHEGPVLKITELKNPEASPSGSRYDWPDNPPHDFILQRWLPLLILKCSPAPVPR